MIYKFERVNDKWLALRQKYVTATDLSALFGMNSYMDTDAMIESKTRKDKLDNKFIRDGKILEPAVVQAIKEDLGWDVGMLLEGSSVVFTDEEHRLSSTPDAFRWDEPAVIECKTVNEMTFNRHWRHDTPPLRYIMQIHAQMITTGMYKGYLAGITAKPNIPLIVYEVTRHKEIDKAIFETVDFFWQNWQTDPELVKKKATNNKRKYMQLVKENVSLVGIYEYPEEKPTELDDDTIFGVKQS